MALLGLVESLVLHAGSMLVDSNLFSSTVRLTPSSSALLQLMVRTSDGHDLRVQLPSSTKVESLQELITKRLSLETTRRVYVILAGHVLDPGMTLRECHLGNCTVLHAAIVDSEAKRKSHFEKLCSNGFVKTSMRSSFFVFCSICNDLKSAKLRVRCSVCKAQSILVNRDPSNYDDVIQHKVIRAHCEKCLKDDCGSNINVGNSEDDVYNTWAEFHFKCVEHTFNEDSMPVLSLLRNRKATSEVDRVCMACGDIDNDEEGDVVAVFQSCEHTLCLNCFRHYLSVRLNERGLRPHPKSGFYTIQCPSNCVDSEMSEVRHFKLLGQTEYEKYHRFAAEQSILEAKGFFCPGINCGNGILVDSQNEDIGNVACPNCRLPLCLRCGQESHNGTSCRAISDPDSQVPSVFNAYEYLSAKTIRMTSKRCPGCHVATERDGGCMHMTCSNCAMQWCWICVEPWDRECMANHWFA